jgi:hypothetical protein
MVFPKFYIDRKKNLNPDKVMYVKKEFYSAQAELIE